MNNINRIVIASILAVLLISCTKPQESSKSQVNSIAEHYVKLVLALGKYDVDYVDAYFGPEKWKEEVEKWNLDVNTIKHQTDSLIKLLVNIKTPELESTELQRIHFLKRMIESVNSRAEILSGKKMSFDK